MPQAVQEQVDRLLSDQSQDQEQLKALAAQGFEQKVKALHTRYRRGEISLGRFAEELKLNVWELTHLLEDLGLSSSNLPGNDA
jgi:hypothetical protein